MTERDEQLSFLLWCQEHENEYPELEAIHYTPVRGRKTYGARPRSLVASRVGWPDFFLPVARREYNGLAIELKVVGGNGQVMVTESQHWWMNRLREEGFMAIICYGAWHAIEMMEWYLSKPSKQPKMRRP